MFSGAGGFDGGVQCQQVRLLGDIVDYLDDLADVIGALTESRDDARRRADGVVDTGQTIRGLLHGRDAGLNFFA